MLEDRVRYEVALRSIGAYFDEHGAHKVNILEAADGFCFRYQLRADDPTLRSGRLQFEDVEELTGHLEWHRNPEKSDYRHQGNGEYQDLFRALGHELDFARAFDVLLDEADDTLLLSYLQLDAAHSVAARKVLVLVGNEERQDVLDNAHQRRESGSADSRSLDTLSAKAKNDEPQESEKAEKTSSMDFAGDGNAWEVGERQLFAMSVKDASMGSEQGPGDVALTNRRILLRFRNGGTYRSGLAHVSDVKSDVRREILVKHYRIELSLSGEVVTMDCQNVEQMNEFLSQLEAARSQSPT